MSKKLSTGGMRSDDNIVHKALALASSGGKEGPWHGRSGFVWWESAENPKPEMNHAPRAKRSEGAHDRPA